VQVERCEVSEEEIMELLMIAITATLMQYLHNVVEQGLRWDTGRSH